jgi:hypothetical protein
VDRLPQPLQSTNQNATGPSVMLQSNGSLPSWTASGRLLNRHHASDRRYRRIDHPLTEVKQGTVDACGVSAATQRRAHALPDQAKRLHRTRRGVGSRCVSADRPATLITRSISTRRLPQQRNQGCGGPSAPETVAAHRVRQCLHADARRDAGSLITPQRRAANPGGLRSRRSLSPRSRAPCIGAC